MKIKILFYLLPICLSTLFSSCEYELSGQNPVQIDSTYQIKEFSFTVTPNNDTLILKDHIAIKYSIPNQPSKFYIRAFLNNVEIYHSSGLNGEFSVNSWQIKDITKPSELILIALKSSGTGSLADLTGFEGSVVKKQWVIIYN